MIKPAFSTVACPEWTLDAVAKNAPECGFEHVELRTFGDDSRRLACDPFLTSEAKIRGLFHARGVEIVGLGTSCRFDAMVDPPVIGFFLSSYERTVREAQKAIDLAVGLECPLVRVHGFEYLRRESKAEALKRIAGRLYKVADHADKSGVRIVVETGGSFSTAAEMLELIARVNHPLIGACYNLATANAVGEDPARGIADLGERLWSARIVDARAGAPCALGDGELGAERFVKALVDSGFDGPLVFDWPRAFIEGLEEPRTALARASETLYRWSRGQSTRPGRANGAPAKAGAR